MAIRKKPHTLTFYPVTEAVDVDNTVQIPTEGAGVEIAGQLTPLTAQAAFDRFGVELRQPHLWMCDADESISVGDVARIGVREFQVKAPPMLWNAISAMSCLECVLEEREIV